MGLASKLPVAIPVAVSLWGLGLAREAAAQCGGRPTDPGNDSGYDYGGAEIRSRGTARVQVFYVESGPHATTPANAAAAAEIADDALARFAAMGFRAPVGDAGCPSHGGDERLDLYLVKFASADGTTVRESCRDRTCASYVLTDATFFGRSYRNARQGFETVVPHEIFHAIQYAYDAELDRFWAEGTAQWATRRLHPALNDLERNLPAFFAESSRSLDAPPAGAAASYLYGTAIWPVFLTERHDDAIVREALEAEAAGRASLDAVDAALAGRGSSLASEFPHFVAWNACTADRAGEGGYLAAHEYPSIDAPPPLEGSSGGVTSGLSNFTYLASADETSTVSIGTDAERNGALLVPLEDGRCRLDRAAPLPASFSGEALVVVTGVSTKKSDAPFTLTLAPGDATASAPDGDGDGGGCGVVASSRRGSAASTAAGALALFGVFAGRARWRRRR